jgi:hypothetical protein
MGEVSAAISIIKSGQKADRNDPAVVLASKVVVGYFYYKCALSLL